MEESTVPVIDEYPTQQRQQRNDKTENDESYPLVQKQAVDYRGNPAREIEPSPAGDAVQVGIDAELIEYLVCYEVSGILPHGMKTE